ncbi:hypothetical protein BWI97_07125 [Siphonobacter sp. BAB-5405]|uniref:hypothetical protein n=1 Tax=Siphonobacter sp. BAB-5405 TaxID=1864825 RepID=UPI000C7FD786|nr:hypothetical protein [Siphonobacter sp. BAB-5405]PMD97394.1 hypothetical protein BWI97_07125 [Siphonobacter sp. BAB-5405]
MSKQTKPITQVMSDLFPNSAKVLSEQLSTEQFNSFTTDASEAAARIEALQDGNKQMKADLEAAVTRATTAEASLKDLQGKHSTLEAEANGLKETNGKLQGWYDNHKAAIDSSTSKADASEGEGALPEKIAKLSANHPNRIAYEMTVANAAKRKAK